MAIDSRVTQLDTDPLVNVVDSRVTQLDADTVVNVVDSRVTQLDADTVVNVIQSRVTQLVVTILSKTGGHHFHKMKDGQAYASRLKTYLKMEM